MKKGFTLIELLAVIVILAVIALIAVPMVLNVVEEAREAAFKDSMYSAFNAVEYYVLEKGLGDVPESGIEAEFLNLKNNSFTSGRFIKNIDGNLIAEFVSDGRYCATGSLTNLNVSKGECEINAPVVDVIVNGKEVAFTITDDNGIVSYVVNTSSEEPTEWPAIEETTSITETLTAETAGTYYIHVKNKYGKVTTKEYEIGQNAFCAYNPGDVIQTFEYTGSPEEFTVPCDGTYKLEVYGAQGGTHGGVGGKGGYVSGNIVLAKSANLYVVVGGKGQNGAGNRNTASYTGGYNGGGAGGQNHNISGSALNSSGGGATHIATTNRGVLANYDLYREEILIVAGGGGGGGGYYDFSMLFTGGAGGLIGGNGAYDYAVYGGVGATTTAGGSGSGEKAGTFGQGGSSNISTIGTGGGGGYFGGGASACYCGGGGGSSYVGELTEATDLTGVREGNGYAQITLVSIN